MAKDLVHNESLLDLLTQQQTRGEAGVRLSFHQDLLSPMSFFLSPLHYAAVTGNTKLVCYLYSQEAAHFINGKNMTVASFAAGGRNGQSSWRIPVNVSPSQAASLAGHAKTAKALRYFESGVPLHWNRRQHKKFKTNEFKNESRKLMSALLDSEWFYALPGPARMRLTEQLMTHLARVHVWGFLDKEIWEGNWESLLDQEIREAVDCYHTTSPDQLTSRQHRYPPQYQFSVGQGTPIGIAMRECVHVVDPQVRRRRRFRHVVRLIGRGISGSLWWFLGRPKGPSILTYLGMFVATGGHELVCSILPAILMMFGDQAHP